MVNPTSDDEQQEMFSVFLTSSTGNVILDPTLSRAVITVEQNGSPFGIISFLGEALTTQRVVEQSVLRLPLERSGDFSTATDVSYRVSRVPGGGDPVQSDVTPPAGVISFPLLQGRTSIDLTILDDDVAEPDETFVVTLTATTGGASINPQANTATFIIKFVHNNHSIGILLEAKYFYSSTNGELFGEYGIVDVTLSASSVDGSIARALTYTIVRRGGNMTGSNIAIQHNYSQVHTLHFNQYYG